MISYITGICTDFLQCGFSCVLSDCHLEKMIYGIADICLVFLQYGFSCALCRACLVGFHHGWRQEQTIEPFLNRTRRMGYLPGDSPAVSEMVREAEDKLGLLSAVTSNQFHVLRRLFPPTTEHKYSLRPRKHDFVFPKKMTRISSLGCCIVVCSIDNTRTFLLNIKQQFFFSCAFYLLHYYYLRLLEKTRCQTAPGYMHTV